ncbi:MAG: hypothetical protein LBS85_05895 [Clostridiales Family XIII bacterium]|jgi:methylated-DNA-[protein]-cysteine S-methyltransferase|nr:hypothetical protein [Clostridiales Family XIII bacterium]
MQYITEVHSPVGLLTVAGDGGNITGLWIKGQKYFGGALDAGLETKAKLLALEGCLNG